MFTEHLALMHVTERADGTLEAADGQPFDEVGYSRFKYGWVPPAIDYGYGLARLIQNDPRLLDRPVLIISAPYKYVPTASHGIARYLRQALALQFTQLGVEPPVIQPFHKSRTGSDRYAKAGHAERLESLRTLGLYIDASRVRDANLLVVDDIRVTGGAQRATAEYVEPMVPHGIWYLHAAVLDPHIANENPGKESVLNRKFPPSLSTIAADIAASEFELNSRTVGFIMKQPDVDWFFSSLPDAQLGQLYDAVIGSGLEFMSRADFGDSVATLRNTVISRSLPVARLQPTPTHS